MRDARFVPTFFGPKGEPARRASLEDSTRLDFTGNFHRAVEVTSDVPARDKARRGI
jgi:hypothetical protein